MDLLLTKIDNPMFNIKYFLWYETHRASLLVDAVLSKDKKIMLFDIVRNEAKIT